jgi:rRNA maturation RNase YbeY
VITFNYLITKRKPSSIRKIQCFIPIIFKKEKVAIEAINYIFCSDEYLLQINKEYLKHDYYTDIITFRLSTQKEPIISDIYISIDRVSDNAKDLKITYHDELLRVIIHGALHLCGYKDKNKADQKLIREMEDKYLKLFKSSFSRGTK